MWCQGNSILLVNNNYYTSGYNSGYKIREWSESIKYNLILLLSKLIPEFYSLAMADQEYLLRSTILELLILKVRIIDLFTG